MEAYEIWVYNIHQWIVYLEIAYAFNTTFFEFSNCTTANHATQATTMTIWSHCNFAFFFKDYFTI